MKKALRFLMISIFLILGLIPLSSSKFAHPKELAYSYLINSYNSTLGLCYEYPNSNVYWVSHDNVLASYVLQNWNRQVADNITETVKKIAEDYNLARSQTGIPLDCRAEILLGYNVNHFFNKTELITLNSSYYGASLKTERATNDILTDFEDYADLLCYASLVEWRKENYSGANYYFEKFKAMWDGKGFRDKAFDTNNYYSVYKLGLFYFLNKMLCKGSFEFEKELIERTWQCQDYNGGFKTDYYGNGSFPSGCKTSTETTSIILLSVIPCKYIEPPTSENWYDNPITFVAIIGVLALAIFIAIKVHERF